MVICRLDDKTIEVYDVREKIKMLALNSVKDVCLKSEMVDDTIVETLYVNFKSGETVGLGKEDVLMVEDTGRVYKMSVKNFKEKYRHHMEFPLIIPEYDFYRISSGVQTWW